VDFRRDPAPARPVAKDANHVGVAGLGEPWRGDDGRGVVEEAGDGAQLAGLVRPGGLVDADCVDPDVGDVERVVDPGEEDVEVLLVECGDCGGVVWGLEFP